MKWASLAVALLAFVLHFASAAQVAQTTSGPITNTAQVRLSGYDRQAGRSVELKARVTYYSPDWPILFIHDDTGGAFIEGAAHYPVVSGDEVEISAITGTQGQVAQPAFRILGRGRPFPEGKPVAYAELRDGAYDSQWVVIEGELSALRLERNHLVLSMEVSADAVFTAMVSERAVSLATVREWLGGRLRVEGVCSTIGAQSSRSNGFRIWVPTSGHLRPMGSPGVDTFERTRTPISRLFNFPPDTIETREEHFSGLVTLVRSTNAFYLQDASGGTYVRSKESVTVRVGEALEVAAKPRMGAYAPILDEARTRPAVGTPAKLPPIPRLEAAALLNGQNEAELVITSGRLLQQAKSGGAHQFVAQSGDTVFAVTLPDVGVSLPVHQPGTLLEFTGICAVESDPHRQPRAVRILSRGPEDVRVLQHMPQLTWPRVLALLAGAAIGFLGVAILLLHRQARLQKRYQQLVNAVSDIIFELDLNGCVISWNPAGQRLTGYAAAEIRDRPLFELLRSSDPSLAPQALLSRLRVENTATFQTEVFNRSGGRRTIEVALTLRQGADGPQFEGVARDITDRVQAEEERLRLERRLQDARRMESLGVLAGGIAHDFNNLLTVILGNSDLVLDELAARSPARQSLEDIKQASLRASDLCRQMLAYAGGGRYQVQDIDLHQLVDDVLSQARTLIPASVDLQICLDPDLPPVRGEAGQLRPLVLALVTNAVEALDGGGGVIRVALGLKQCRREDFADPADADLGLGAPAEGPYVCLEVSDTGPGMSPEIRQKIFEPFFTTKFTGRGLGLPAALGIVRGHHGFIKVQSEPGVGSVFRVFLPPAVKASTVAEPLRDEV